jgi:hypothetical protein
VVIKHCDPVIQALNNNYSISRGGGCCFLILSFSQIVMVKTTTVLTVTDDGRFSLKQCLGIRSDNL